MVEHVQCELHNLQELGQRHCDLVRCLKKHWQNIFLTNFVAVQNPFARTERLPVQKWLKLLPDDELGRWKNIPPVATSEVITPGRITEQDIPTGYENLNQCKKNLLEDRRKEDRGTMSLLVLCLCVAGRSAVAAPSSSLNSYYTSQRGKKLIKFLFCIIQNQKRAHTRLFSLFRSPFRS